MYVCKNGVLKNFTKFTGKHLCQRLVFNKVAGLRPATLLRERLWHSCFPVNFMKFLRTLFLQGISGDCFFLLQTLHKTEISMFACYYVMCKISKFRNITLGTVKGLIRIKFLAGDKLNSTYFLIFVLNMFTQSIAKKYYTKSGKYIELLLRKENLAQQSDVSKNIHFKKSREKDLFQEFFLLCIYSIPPVIILLLRQTKITLFVYLLIKPERGIKYKIL